jgi:hypothetical protein
MYDRLVVYPRLQGHRDVNAAWNERDATQEWLT